MELLVVIGIMAVMMAIAVPAALHIKDGFSVTAAGQLIQAELLLCRQQAVTRNCTVEIRFYEVPDASGKDSHFSMFRSWVYDSQGGNPQPLGNFTSLPQGVVIDAKPVNGTSGATKCSSTIIDHGPSTGTQEVPSTPPKTVPYRGFSYRGSGAPNLSLNGTGAGDTWFISTRSQRDNPGTGSLPKNYYSLQVDPVTGQTKVFRP